MPTTMVFNIQKDRDHSVQLREVEHFARGGKDKGSPEVAGLLSFNEVYHLGKSLGRTLEDEGYGWNHPAEEPGQNWCAAAWDLSFWHALELRVVLMAADGYQNLPPRWATMQRLRYKPTGAVLLWWVLHYPPSWELGIVRGNVPERVANAREMNRRIRDDVKWQRRIHPRAHAIVTGDYNCSSLNTRNPEYPAVYYPKNLKLEPAWTPALKREAGGGTLGARPVDDMFHSSRISVDGVELAGFEQSDHEPPIFRWHFDRKFA